MQFEHRCGMAPTPVEREELARLGVEILDSGGPLVRSVVAKVTEDHPGWPYVKTMIQAKRASDILTTHFSEEEEKAASHLKLSPTWHHGYPMPRPNSYGYREVSYAPNGMCPIVGGCGAGTVQVAPFQMKAEPKWGKKHLLQLYWAYTEFFVRSEI